MVQVTLAGLGLGALVAAFPAAFDAIRVAGVIYLLWLAWRTLRTPIGGHDLAPVRASRAFWDGVLVNMTNPKVILFILAFVPQFVDPARAVLPQFLIFGSVLAIGGFAINGAVGYFAGGLGRRIAESPAFERRLRWFSASIFGVLAARVAWEVRG
jgi:threonine/homoserine/homoserine lactone efflux protein